MNIGNYSWESLADAVKQCNDALLVFLLFNIEVIFNVKFVNANRIGVLNRYEIYLFYSNVCIIKDIEKFAYHFTTML